jgi:hypothetical protein
LGKTKGFLIRKSGLSSAESFNHNIRPSLILAFSSMIAGGAGGILVLKKPIKPTGAAGLDEYLGA